MSSSHQDLLEPNAAVACRPSRRYLGRVGPRHVAVRSPAGTGRGGPSGTRRPHCTRLDTLKVFALSALAARRPLRRCRFAWTPFVPHNGHSPRAGRCSTFSSCSPFGIHVRHAGTCDWAILIDVMGSPAPLALGVDGDGAGHVAVSRPNLMRTATSSGCGCWRLRRQVDPSPASSWAQHTWASPVVVRPEHVCRQLAGALA
jgi:hypothetical protein